jgi:hypothetical protein
MNAVRRDGDVVRRAAGPWTPTVHRFLRQLREQGMDVVPRPLGTDGDDELLEFIHGEVPLYPMPDWVWDDAVLQEGARLLRRLHDASVGFPLDGATWQSPSRLPLDVVCHNDFSPHNLVFSPDHRIVGIIDVDMCAPGSRIWDIAYFATRIVPLDAASALPDAEAGRRVRLLLEAYGSDESVVTVLRVAALKVADLESFTREAAVRLGKPDLQRHAEGYRADVARLRELAIRLEDPGALSR